MRFLYFSVRFIWRACWSSGIMPGKFHWTVWIGVGSWWGQPLKMRCQSELPGKAASWISLKVVFHHIFFSFSVQRHSCFCNVFLSKCYWGQVCEIWPRGNFNWVWGREPDSTEDGECKQTFGSPFQTPSLPRKIPFVPVLIGAAPCWGRLLMRVMLWLLCGDFQYGTSFDPRCTLL